METQKPLIKEQIVKIVDEHLYKIQDWNIEYLTSSKALNTGLQLVNTVRLNLMLPVQVNAAEDDFITTSIQFWETAKARTINGERHLQALLDKKKIVITESIIRRDLHLEDAEGTDCLPTATSFEELTRIGYEKLSQKLTFYKAFFSPQWKFLIHTILQCLSAKTTAWHEFSSTMASAIICLAKNQNFNFSKYIFDNMVKNLEDPITDEATNEEHVSTPSYDPPQSGEDRLQLNELMDLCTKISDRVLILENTNTSQAAEIATLKEKVKKLEKKKRSRTHKHKRLYKVGFSRRIESSDEGLGNQEDASKQGRKIVNIDADAEVTLVDETQGMNDDNLMFDTNVLDEQEVEVENLVSTTEVTTVSATTTTVEELTLAQT
ncbi:hypothetical protein Tco_0923488 [Tanacetum coccineum]|uniref:Synaptobrevin, longin-like domain protein n=1 Tax=Tanacetum coccineum TaxID=301880 RepID=A0ABQ5D894_9ASTR